MSLEVFGDEGSEPNPFDDMMSSLRISGSLWSCWMCQYLESLKGQPCRICGLDEATVEFYRNVFDRYQDIRGKRSPSRHWIVAAVEAYREVVAEIELEQGMTL